MSSFILAYDLGTGGVKAILYDESGASLAGSFISYDTRYPAGGWHEQRPEDWWYSSAAFYAGRKDVCMDVDLVGP